MVIEFITRAAPSLPENEEIQLWILKDKKKDIRILFRTFDSDPEEYDDSYEYKDEINKVISKNPELGGIITLNPKGFCDFLSELMQDTYEKYQYYDTLNDEEGLDLVRRSFFFA